MKWSRAGFVLMSVICWPGSAQEQRGASPTSALADVGASPTSALADVAEWVRANPAPIHTLARFRTVPRAMERRVFMTLPADVQFRLWKEKLAETIASGELDERQLGIVAVADCFVTPELYASDLMHEAEDFLQALEADARSVFSAERFDELFLTLGIGAGSPEDFTPAAAVLPAGDCECNTGRDYCGGNLHCQRTGGRCNVTRGGCGFCGSTSATACACAAGCAGDREQRSKRRRAAGRGGFPGCGSLRGFLAGPVHELSAATSRLAGQAGPDVTG